MRKRVKRKIDSSIDRATEHDSRLIPGIRENQKESAECEENGKKQMENEGVETDEGKPNEVDGTLKEGNEVSVEPTMQKEQENVPNCVKIATKRKRRPRPHDKSIASLVRTGHILACGGVDAGTVFMFERSIEALWAVGKLSLDAIRALAPYLSFAKRSIVPFKNLAFISDPSTPSRREWLGSPGGIAFRDSVNQARSKRLVVARQAMFERWCEIIGKEPALWPPYFSEYNISELLLNCELFRIFSKPPDKSIPEPGVEIDWGTVGQREREHREQKRCQRGKFFVEVIMVGVLALAEKSATDEVAVFDKETITARSLFSTTDESINATDESFLHTAQQLNLLKHRTSLAFEGLCQMVLAFVAIHSIDNRQPNSSTCISQHNTQHSSGETINDSSSNTNQIPSINASESPPARKACHLPHPFDADAKFMEVTESFRAQVGCDPAAHTISPDDLSRGELAGSFALSLLIKLGTQRKVQTYRSAVQEVVDAMEAQHQAGSANRPGDLLSMFAVKGSDATQDPLFSKLFGDL